MAKRRVKPYVYGLPQMPGNPRVNQPQNQSQGSVSQTQGGEQGGGGMPMPPIGLLSRLGGERALTDGPVTWTKDRTGDIIWDKQRTGDVVWDTARGGGPGGQIETQQLGLLGDEPGMELSPYGGFQPISEFPGLSGGASGFESGIGGAAFNTPYLDSLGALGGQTPLMDSLAGSGAFDLGGSLLGESAMAGIAPASELASAGTLAESGILGGEAAGLLGSGALESGLLGAGGLEGTGLLGGGLGSLLGGGAAATGALGGGAAAGGALGAEAAAAGPLAAMGPAGWAILGLGGLGALLGWF